MATVSEGDGKSPGRSRKPCQTIITLIIMFLILPFFIFSDNIDLTPLQKLKFLFGAKFFLCLHALWNNGFSQKTFHSQNFMIELKHFLVPGCSCILFTLSVTKLRLLRCQFQFSIHSSQSSSLNHDSKGKTSSLSATLKITVPFNNYWTRLSKYRDLSVARKSFTCLSQSARHWQITIM